MQLGRSAKLSCLIGSAALALGVAGSARADIITTLVGSPVQSGNQYLWTYDVELSFDSMLTPGQSMAQFGTLYDASKTTPVIENVTGDLASDFTFSFPLVAPAAYNVSPTDNPSLYDVRYTYNNSVGTPTLEGLPYDVTIGSQSIEVGTNLLDLGQFTLVSPSNAEVLTNYDGESFNSFGSAAGTPQGNLGFTDVPTAVPEPASLSAMGLTVVGLLGRRRRRA
jgi:hypothetical protein